MKTISVSLTLAVTLALSSPALAAKTNAPPGNSSAGEYLESIPTSGGNRGTSSFPRGGGTGASGVLSSSTRRALDRLGSEGKAAADLAERTSPAASSTKSARPSRGAVEGSRASGGGSPLSAVLKRVFGGTSGGGGSGALLPIALFAAFVGLAAIALVRRRQTSQR